MSFHFHSKIEFYVLFGTKNLKYPTFYALLYLFIYLGLFLDRSYIVNLCLRFCSCPAGIDKVVVVLIRTSICLSWGGDTIGICWS